MAYSSSQNKATQKYVKANCDRIYITLPKGLKEAWKQAADNTGESLTEFIRRSVEQRMQNK